MKIGYLRLDHGEWTSGAYNSQEIGLAKAFEKMGHEVTIFYNVFRSDEKCGTSVAITAHIKKSYLPAGSLGHHAVLNMKVLDRFDLDVLHIQGDNLIGVPAAVQYCKKRRIKHYCYVGRLDSEKSGKIHRFLMRQLIKRNIAVYKRTITFVKNPSVQKELLAYGAKQVEVAPVGLDLTIIPEIVGSKEQLRNELELPQDRKILLCVSRLVKGKQPYDIFKLAKKLDHSFYYVFIGGWDEEAENRFRQRIIDENLEKSMRYIPRIKNAEIHKYYRAVDKVVNFNENEIFGMVVLEAMYQGATVIAKKAPGPSYIIENGKSGFIAETIDEMAEMVQHGAILGDNARRRIIEDFSWDHTAQIFLERLMGEER